MGGDLDCMEEVLMGIVKTTCSTILLKLPANGLQHVYEKWVERCKKCIACQGRYFVKEAVTAPLQSTDSE
jgi:hypothetical protein